MNYPKPSSFTQFIEQFHDHATQRINELEAEIIDSLERVRYEKEKARKDDARRRKEELRERNRMGLGHNNCPQGASEKHPGHRGYPDGGIMRDIPFY